jgi:hypothetical protein
LGGVINALKRKKTTLHCTALQDESRCKTKNKTKHFSFKQKRGKRFVLGRSN